MTQEEHIAFAETVHENGRKGGNRAKEIIFVDGQFVFPSNGERPEGGDAVTRLTQEGFGADPLPSLPAREEIYSRTRGIFEVDTLEDKRVLIIGLGSFGSRIAVALVQEGVGAFSLMDFDVVELHNLSRHIATVHDLGRLKTDVLEDAIHGKNPYAVVDKFPVNVLDNKPLLYDEVRKADIVICATDNNPSRVLISKALKQTGRVGIFGRAFTRAEGGDVLRYHPGGPCYCCLFGGGDDFSEEITNVASARRDGRIPAYTSEEDADAQVFIGLSSDIEPICNLMVKLALVELSRGRADGLAGLDSELEYDYYLWANRRDRYFSNWHPFPGGGQPTILRWYGVRIDRDENCPVCGEGIVLEDAEGSPISGLENAKIDLD